MKNSKFKLRLLSKKVLATTFGVTFALGMAANVQAATIVDEDGVTTGYFGGNKYQVIDQQSTWKDAAAYCESQGGHLVTITSAEEQAFIEQLIENAPFHNYWLGATSEKNDEYPTRQWRWINGEEWGTYANWGTKSNGDKQPDAGWWGSEAYLGIVNHDGKDYGEKFTWNDYENKDRFESHGILIEFEDVEEPKEDEDQVNPLDYTVFSGTDVLVAGAKTTIKGNIYGNAINTYDANKLEITGNVDTVQHPELGNATRLKGQTHRVGATDVPDWNDGILSHVNVEKVEDDVNFNASQNVKESIYTAGNVNFTEGTYNYKGYIVADGDITIDATKFSSSNGSVIYSTNGNVTIIGDNFNFKGVIYAPNGTVSVEAAQNNITGRIFGEKVEINSPKFTIKTGSNDEALVQ